VLPYVAENTKHVTSMTEILFFKRSAKILEGVRDPSLVLLAGLKVSLHRVGYGAV